MAATKETAPRANRPQIASFAAIALPALIFSAFVARDLGRRPMWRDETATREFAMLSFHGLARAVSHVDLVMAPYYALMHVMVVILSPHTSVLRLPSALASILTLVFMSTWVRSRWGNLAALVTGSFLAINATFLSTATTARAYALAAMFLACALWVTTSKVRQGIVVGVWAFACSAACLMQLFSVLVLPALAIALAARVPWRRACLWTAIPLICAGAVLALTRSQSSQVGWIPRVSLHKAIREAADALAGRTVWVVLGLVALGTLLGCVRKGLNSSWCVLVVATVLPPLALWAVSEVTNPVFLMRYATFFIPALAGLLGASVGLLVQGLSFSWGRIAVAAVAILALSMNSFPDFHAAIEERAGADSTASLPRALAGRVHIGDVVIYEAAHAAGGQIYGWALYGHDESLQHDLLRQLPLGEGAMLQERRVLSLHPFATTATSHAAATTWIVNNSGEHGPRPDLRGCQLDRSVVIDRVVVKRMSCQ